MICPTPTNTVHSRGDQSNLGRPLGQSAPLFPHPPSRTLTNPGPFASAQASRYSVRPQHAPIFFPHYMMAGDEALFDHYHCSIRYTTGRWTIYSTVRPPSTGTTPSTPKRYPSTTIVAGIHRPLTGDRSSTEVRTEACHTLSQHYRSSYASTESKRTPSRSYAAVGQ